MKIIVKKSTNFYRIEITSRNFKIIQEDESRTIQLEKVAKVYTTEIMYEFIYNKRDSDIILITDVPKRRRDNLPKLLDLLIAKNNTPVKAVAPEIPA